MQTVDCPKAVLFDLDDTLAPSFEPPSSEMIQKLLQVLARMPSGIVTGRDFAWMEKDFLSKVTSKEVRSLYVISESGAQGSYWDGEAWHTMYEHTIELEERARIHESVEAAVKETGVLVGLPIFGKQFVDRKAAVAFSCTGWDVPKDVRYTWDLGNVRRKKLREHLAAMLPEYEVLMGGATTVDVTKKGVNKAFGIQALSEHLGIPPREMLYIGDALYPGGNDYVVLETGIPTRATSGPEETLKLIDEMLAACAVRSTRI